ncbi:WUSCHEL-related homeobox 8-like [Nymphaea colorata]|nr:WUSCHEL-related homeobox 8-like [Nymphaea colorata]
MGGRNGGRMEGEELKQQQNGGGVGGNAGLYVKVMTDEQMELLRRQISVYATICEQLVEMHKASTAQQDSVAGMRLGNIYADPSMAAAGHKVTTRQRWTPSQMQLQILESIFEQGNGTPSKQKIKEITAELSQHGPISETNVYNWFQNRRARSKRKQQGTSANIESEVDTEVESPQEKRSKAENINFPENPALHVDGLSFRGQEVSSYMRSMDPQPSKMLHMQSNDDSKSSGNLTPFSFLENMLTNPRMEHLMGKMEGPASFNPFHGNEGFDMIG